MIARSVQIASLVTMCALAGTACAQGVVVRRHPGKRGAHANQQPGAAGRAANPVPFSLLQGKPKVKHGTTTGFFIWREGNAVCLMTTSTVKQGIRFNGRIGVQGGTIAGAVGERDERKDIWKVVSPTELDFSFDTHTATDGVKFTVTGGTAVTLALNIQGQPTDRVFLGGRELQAGGNPVILDLAK